MELASDLQPLPLAPGREARARISWRDRTGKKASSGNPEEAFLDLAAFLATAFLALAFLVVVFFALALALAFLALGLLASASIAFSASSLTESQHWR